MFRTALVGSGLVALALGAGSLMFRAGFAAGSATVVAQPEGEMDQDAMMQMMMKAATPGPQHAELAESVGAWKAHTSFSMGGEVSEGDGTMQVKSILDGRFVMSHFDGVFSGMPFKGVGINGYDNVKGEYVAIWLDSFGTGITMLTGQKKGDDVVMQGTSTGPMGEHEMRIVTSRTDDDTMVDTFYDKMGDEWVQSGTITYTRK